MVMTSDQSPQIEVTCLKPGSLFSAKTEARIGTWNVRTLSQAVKLEQLRRNFDEYRLDLLGISEMRWTESGRSICEGKTVLYSVWPFDASRPRSWLDFVKNCSSSTGWLETDFKPTNLSSIPESTRQDKHHSDICPDGRNQRRSKRRVL